MMIFGWLDLDRRRDLTGGMVWIGGGETWAIFYREECAFYWNPLQILKVSVCNM